MAKAAVHLRVLGHVQGVGYRYFIKTKAEILNLTGWVRNRFDESVEIWAEGDKEPLQELIETANRGPNQAYVMNIDLNWQAPTDQYSRFSIAPTE